MSDLFGFPPLQLINGAVPYQRSRFVFADAYGNNAFPSTDDEVEPVPDGDEVIGIPLGIYYDTGPATTVFNYVAQFYPLGWAALCPIELGGTVSNNKWLQPDSEGRGVAATGLTGYALTANSGVAGDYVQVFPRLQLLVLIHRSFDFSFGCAFS